MLYFLLQLFDTMKTHQVFLFEVFVIYAWIVYLVKWYYATKYSPTTQFYKASVSVIVPVLKEDPILFEKCLKSIKSQHPNEFFVILDKLESDKTLREVASKYATTIKAENEGKRDAIALGVKISTSDIVVIADSDTIFTKNCIKELLKPFADASVGGVTTKQKIINQKGNIIRVIAGWMEDVRFSIGSIPCQSVFGSIGCLPGRAIAFRRSCLIGVLDDFLSETFFGKKCNSGDDRVLSGLMLKNSYKTVYQSTALVYTDCPNTWGKFVKQQLRWSRSSQRETVLSLKWIFRYPMTAFVFITDILTPFFFTAVLIDSAYRYITGDVYFNIPLSVAFIMAVVGMNITTGLKQFPHIDIHPKDVIYFPIYVLFLTAVMTPIRIIGFLTMQNSTWMTRSMLTAVETRAA